MKTSTRNATDMIGALGRRDFTVASIEVHTPDGRTWAIDTTNVGRFRLFEIDAERQETEHDAEDGSWSAGDLIDYLEAVGEPKPGSCGALIDRDLAPAAPTPECMQEDPRRGGRVMNCHSIFDHDLKRRVWPFGNTDPAPLEDGYVSFPIGDGHAEAIVRPATMSADGLRLSSVHMGPTWGTEDQPEYAMHTRQSPIAPWTLKLRGCRSDPVRSER